MFQFRDFRVYAVQARDCFLRVGDGSFDRGIDLFERDALFQDIFLVNVRLYDDLLFCRLVAFAEYVVVTRADCVDPCGVAVVVVRVLPDVDRAALDVEPYAVSPVRGVRHGEIGGEDSFLDHEARRRVENGIIVCDRCGVAILFRRIVRVEVDRRLPLVQGFERDARPLRACQQVVGRAGVLIVAELIVINVGVCDVVPGECKSLAKCE